jgi:peptide/nickel transport system ATP-binding protein
VQPKCLDQEPPLVDSADHGHQFRCWYPVGTPENRAALEANQKAGLDSALAVGAV